MLQPYREKFRRYFKENPQAAFWFRASALFILFLALFASIIAFALWVIATERKDKLKAEKLKDRKELLEKREKDKKYNLLVIDDEALTILKEQRNWDVLKSKLQEYTKKLTEVEYNNQKQNNKLHELLDINNCENFSLYYDKFLLYVFNETDRLFFENNKEYREILKTISVLGSLNKYYIEKEQFKPHKDSLKYECNFTDKIKLYKKLAKHLHPNLAYNAPHNLSEIMTIDNEALRNWSEKLIHHLFISSSLAEFYDNGEPQKDYEKQTENLLKEIDDIKLDKNDLKQLSLLLEKVKSLRFVNDYCHEYFTAEGSDNFCNTMKQLDEKFSHRFKKLEGSSLSVLSRNL